MGRAKSVRDPVHGYIEVEPPLLPVVDAPLLQRLRQVRQLGFAYLVYPGANHTRFEHSLGAMHLARRLCEHLGLDPGTTLTVTAAALLHDAGHGPYSHATEPFLLALIGRGHQEIREIVETSGLDRLLAGIGVDPGEVCRLVSGDHPLAGIIQGELDVDRMDYLLRDAHYTGVPYGTVDAERLIRSVRMTGHGLAIDEGGIAAAESLLVARTLMRPSVYFHHVARIAEGMFTLALDLHLETPGGAGEAAALLASDDGGCMQALLRSPHPGCRELAERIMARRLYKRAVWVGRDQVNWAALPAGPGIAWNRETAGAIAESAGVEPGEVIVDAAPFPRDLSMEVRIRSGSGTLPLDQCSPMVATLNETRRGQWRLGVYAPPAAVERVAASAVEHLHIRPATLQERLPV
ncbi:MAG: HD domain-containing protein [Methanospirillum sp.]|nr:HD domain-containing protein [Methanospirillum sp.]